MERTTRFARIAAAAVAMFIVALWSPQATEAKAKGKKSLRTEVTALQQELAQLRASLAVLESRVEFEARQDAGAPTSPVGGICGDPCAQDSDGDGVGDCEDFCPCDVENADADADGVPDCADPCPDDATDACIDPCHIDSDGDGTNDCEDPCPWDPAPASDRDADGVPDCQDPCPDEPSNECIGPCPLLDQDGDGVRDCTDPCPFGSTQPCVSPAGEASTGGP
jgi:thrombospondin type 3 repeat protein